MIEILTLGVKQSKLILWGNLEFLPMIGASYIKGAIWLDFMLKWQFGLDNFDCLLTMDLTEIYGEFLLMSCWFDDNSYDKREIMYKKKYV